MSEQLLIDRRGLLHAARAIVGVGVLGAVSLLVLKKPGAASGDDCIRKIACTSCSVFAHCDLPRALLNRKAADHA
jgi:hypothetical protein